MSTIIAALRTESFNRKGTPWMMYPVFLWVACTILYFMFGGGKDLGATDEMQTQSMGFNTNVPTAEDTDLKHTSIDHPAYGSSREGQVLSTITNTREATNANQMQGFPDDAATTQAASYSTTSASAANLSATAKSAPAPYTAAPTTVKARRGRKNAPNYNYHPAQPYYVGSNQTDAQLEQKLTAYQSARQPSNQTTSQASTEASETPGISNQPLGVTNSSAPHNFIQLDDNRTASRLDQGTPSPVVENPFNTAPVGSNRQQGVATTLQSSGHSRQAVTTLIPAVVHDDQSVKAGQPVKIRLTKAVIIDGIRVPANTIVHATCQPNGDRLRLVVQNLQLGGQLIPLNLEAIDLDGGEGVNAPGLSDQLGGQIKSSAVQGVNLPTRSMLVNTVLNAARFGASSSVRQLTIHLKGGYHLYLKSI